MTTTTLLIALVILSVIMLTLLVSTFILHTRLKKLLEGEHGRSLEKVIHDIIKDVRTLEEKSKVEESKLTHLIEETKHHVKTPQMLRYKALESNNSNQSFSIALVDSHGDGSVLTTLHIRDRVSFYAKKIEKWQSELELTEEEQNVIASAGGKKK